MRKFNGSHESARITVNKSFPNNGLKNGLHTQLSTHLVSVFFFLTNKSVAKFDLTL